MNTTKKILIYGVGQIGSRHLQGLIYSKLSLEIFLYDPSKESIQVAISRWSEVSDGVSNKKIILCKDITDIPKEIDVVIHATSAEHRLQSILNLIEVSSIKFWLIEKVLAQSCKQLDQLGDCIKTNAWVNTPRRELD